MKHINTILCIGLISIILQNCDAPPEDQSSRVIEKTDSLPSVLPANYGDLIGGKLKLEAILKFGEHELPNDLKAWESYRIKLKDKIIEKTGALVKQTLPLDLKETGVVQMDGYSIRKITFQTRPGVLATANLYVPDGEGPFPGVIVMAGHFLNGRLGTQSLGYLLALNGFVSMTIDPWGAGERTTEHGSFEYHGANLGASLMNVGETLMGVQITDNIRGVDLLSSLPYVDPNKIGATGASGGGNQTMWLAAMDERVKAAVPVVSVGTFESYVMGHNCICEVLVDGLTFTEESGILALVAPRALLISNGLKDSNGAFNPSEMTRSFQNAMPVFEMYGAEDKLSHLIFDGPHSYPPETREAMLNLFNRELKGNTAVSPQREVPEHEGQPNETIMVFTAHQRDAAVESTAEFCIRKGEELRSAYLNIPSFDINQKKTELNEILGITEKDNIRKINTYASIDGWDRLSIETAEGKLIPVLHLSPADNAGEYTIISNPKGARKIPLALIDELKQKGSGIAIVDLSGTGEAASTSSSARDQTAKLHTVSRAELWLGKTVIGEWTKELNVVTEFLKSNYEAEKVSIDGSKEAGLAGLFLSAMEGNIENVIVRDGPVSYVFDDRETVDFYSMGIHLPGFLKWGDVSLVAALSGKNVTFINPLTMSGQKITGSTLTKYQKEFDNIRTISNQAGKTVFN